jgi:hypothetical protein
MRVFIVDKKRTPGRSLVPLIFWLTNAFMVWWNVTPMIRIHAVHQMRHLK